MTAMVRVEFEGDVAFVLIDNPPINAGSAAVRKGLLQAFLSLSNQESVRGIVLLGAGRTFMSGSDLREFGAALTEPQLPAVIAAIEACPKPVVAGLHGAALGGGLELALGCDARVAHRDTVVGLPEVTLGIIPGAGGTQRLPRLTWVPTAIRLICTGERIPAATALKMGLVDQVVTGDLRTAAMAHVLALNGKKRRVRDTEVPAAHPAEVTSASEACLKKGRFRPAVQAAIQAVVASVHTDIDEALTAERSAFQTLRLSRDAFALRHLFFAERACGKLSGPDASAEAEIQRVAVIGAGTMGSGIAMATLEAGFDVLLLEQSTAALEGGLRRIHDQFCGRVKAGKDTPERVSSLLQRLHGSVDWSGLADCDLVIEAVFEDLPVKRQVIERVDGLARQGAILASNTSYLDLDEIAAATKRPQDVIGLHFFSPAQVMKLLEVVRGRESSPRAMASGVAFSRRLKKLPVLARNSFGFIGNRVFSAYRKQCEFMMEEGAAPQQIDSALEAFGFAMGPFAVADLSGLDIAWRVRQARSYLRDSDDRYVDIADRLCERGRLGRKAGAGYYAYSASDHVRQIDLLTQELIEEARRSKGVTPRTFANEEVVQRALMSMVNETALLLSEGIAERASDVDVAMVNGYGFPRWEGGPVFWGREQGGARLATALDQLQTVSGPGFLRGDLGWVLNQSS